MVIGHQREKGKPGDEGKRMKGQSSRPSDRRRTWRVILVKTLIVTAATAHAVEPDFGAIDQNENGFIELSEIPPQNLTVISRYASLADHDINQPVPIEALIEGRERYFHHLDGGGVDVEVAGQREFGRVQQSGVRPFGIVGEYAGRYTSDIRQATITTFRKFDANRDGLLTEAELSIAYRVYAQLWMRGDRNGNGVLTFPELANSLSAERDRRQLVNSFGDSTWSVDGIEITPENREYANRLIKTHDKNGNSRLEGDEIPREWKTGNILAWADRNKDGRISRTEMQSAAARLALDAQESRERKSDPNLLSCEALAADLIRRFDLDKDRTLRQPEWQRIGESFSGADLNGNGLIVEKELIVWLLENVSAQSNAGLPEDVPDWFLESDTDSDGQVIHAELVASQMNNELLAEFSKHDRNSDGIVTPMELGQRDKAGMTWYAGHGQRVLEAQKETYCDVFVPKTVTIGDLDVYVCISKDVDDVMELRLMSPDGTTVMLYHSSTQKAWGGGPLFDGTFIDDEAPASAQRLPRPPAHRSFRPQSMRNAKLASLSAFYGKSAEGRWRLTIRNKGRTAGLLDGWALLVKPTQNER